MRRTGTVAMTAAALLIGLMGIAMASPPTAASGTITQGEVTGFDIRFAGPNVILTQSTAGTVNGTLQGTYQDTFRVVIHPNGKFNAHGKLTCECTVGGRSGVLELSVTNTGEEIDGVPTFEGRFVIKRGTRELAGLHGVLTMGGAVDPATGLSTIDYAGQIHFDPR